MHNLWLHTNQVFHFKCVIGKIKFKLRSLWWLWLLFVQNIHSLQMNYFLQVFFKLVKMIIITDELYFGNYLNKNVQETSSVSLCQITSKPHELLHRHNLHRNEAYRTDIRLTCLQPYTVFQPFWCWGTWSNQITKVTIMIVNNRDDLICLSVGLRITKMITEARWSFRYVGLFSNKNRYADVHGTRRKRHMNTSITMK